ncbi:MAG: DUF3109 family protein [Microbacter sp.]
MIQIEDTIVRRDLVECHFACDVSKCKGICCVEGEEGAPVTDDEVKEMEKLLPLLWNDLSENVKKIIENQGIAYFDKDHDLAISTVNGAECIFAFQNEEGIWLCRLEKLFEAGQSTFKKPISCHLYPIRIQQYDTFAAVNYHQWSICRQAVENGKENQILVYQFLKEPLIRRFGIDWFEQLHLAKEFIDKKSKQEKKSE